MDPRIGVQSGLQSGLQDGQHYTEEFCLEKQNEADRQTSKMKNKNLSSSSNNKNAIEEGTWDMETARKSSDELTQAELRKQL